MNYKIINPSPLVQQFKSQAPRGKALDIGFGNGNDSIFLAQQGFSVTAISINQRAVDELKENSETNKRKINVLLSDMREFAVEENAYSLIVAMNSLNFISKEEFLEMIDKIKKGLMTSGVCIISLFTVDDELFEEIKIKTKGTFQNEQGKKWYFPKPNELKELFEEEFEILFYKEMIVDDKGHAGKEQPHKHAVARLVAKNRSV